MARDGKTSKKLAGALARRKKLAREFQRARAGAPKRIKLVAQIKKLDAYIGPQRKRVADRERDALTARDRVKQLRQFVSGYESDDGYDLRRPKDLTKKQRARIEADWQKLVPVLARPHTKARPRRTHEAEDLKAVAEFAGIKKLPKGLKAVPVVAMAKEPKKVRVRVDSTGEVQKTRGAVTERYYLFTRDEKLRIKRTGRVDVVLRDLLARMPKGQYFAVTGEAEAFNAAITHDGPQSAKDKENLLARQVSRWIGEYGSTVEKWLRGFRWIGTVNDDNAGKRERKRINAARKRRERERRERRNLLGERARERAAHVIPKK